MVYHRILNIVFCTIQCVCVCLSVCVCVPEGCGFISGPSILFHWSIFLFWWLQLWRRTLFLKSGEGSDWPALPGVGTGPSPLSKEKGCLLEVSALWAAVLPGRLVRDLIHPPFLVLSAQDEHRLARQQENWVSSTEKKHVEHRSVWNRT